MGASDHPDTRSANGAVDRVIEVRTQESELRAIRAAVDEFVSSNGGDADLATDFQLAACELATNVIQHSDADVVTVSMRRDGALWQLDVSDGGSVPDLDSISRPSPSSPTGRGLMIVQSLMDVVRVVDLDDATVIRCERRTR